MEISTQRAGLAGMAPVIALPLMPVVAVAPLGPGRGMDLRAPPEWLLALVTALPLAEVAAARGP